jgi:hypothetical protein
MTDVESPAPTSADSAEPEALTCAWHPDRPTMLRCTRCNRPMCPKCARKHPVGWRCKACTKELRSPLYVVGPGRYVLAGAVALGAGTAAAALMTVLGGFWFVAVFAGYAIGQGIGELVSLAAGRKQGRGLQIVAAGAMLLGAFAVGVVSGGLVRGLGVFLNLGLLIYLVVGIGAAWTRLK